MSQRFALSGEPVVWSFHAGFISFLDAISPNSRIAVVGLVTAYAEHLGLCTFYRYAGAG